MTARTHALVASGLLALAAGVWWWRSEASTPSAAEHDPRARRRAMKVTAPLPSRRPAGSGDAGASVAARGAPAIEQLVEELARVLELPEGDEAERSRQRLEAELLRAGEAAVPALIARLDGPGTGSSARERLFDLLRRLPGSAAEPRLAEEARRGRQDTLRTMAIESLGQRGSDLAFETLAGVARQDPLLPVRPLLGPDRQTDDSSTELPDEAVFTPRMQAMSALAATGDVRAVPVLVDIVSRGPDPALRMEAARNLARLRADDRARQALQTAAIQDASAVVRLAALHALRGSEHPGWRSVLEQLAGADRDAGVRALARELLAASP